ncbi:exopolyphosphatase PRUNE1 [Nasonia vitripennis]|uniref:DHHA2 domain-containing protein n=1 Tax=Nasonia vitripennis TaxID=7425 RepID=A0A7M7Q632_NASVI|nr:exopolyphosphatase PRUNE1 [Nasonia vitripennis]XP_008208196.1 exopolyphosphatase PRUNE1 [Nasonia vitripennis]XP_031780482.1 exopolyphosphatase PRUNE1 [Nasonia vitripennis]XP_032451741.1 exopolyphosphatase PRUNE1 [Nasonia vitripennis]XP_032451742.1 exopolyphosphatase PRUNE1 [Nasonia vitripennis]
MEAFLAATRNYLANLNNYQRVRVILGNSTCDLDSAVCALAHGFLEYKEAEEREDESLAVIPVMNVSRQEFRLRTEVVYYLNRCNVPQDLLTFRNEIELKPLLASGKLELVLVDHHALPADDAELFPAVLEVIDHRPQDSNWPWTNCRLALDTVGSCASLVARNIIQRRPDVAATVASLLKGPILIDTANFSEEAKRATPLDHEMIAKLEEISDGDAQVREKLYQEILQAKTDISELTPVDLLIRDLKVVNGVPIPGFPILVKDFLELDGAREALEAFCAARNCQLAVLIGLDLRNDRVMRDIAVYSLGAGQLAKKLIEALTASSSPDLQLTEAKRMQQDGGNSLLLLYKQANVQASRKQILPVIQSASA